MENDCISRQAAISAICNACGKIDCDKMDKCEKLQLPPANCSEFPNNSDTISRQDAVSRRRLLSDLKELITAWEKYPVMAEQIKGVEVAIGYVELIPSAQPETHEKRTETHACDLIDRQAAIDIERNATVDTNPSHFEAHQKFTQFMNDAEISSFGRWQWSNGFNTALTAVGIDLKKLPTAQPEITLESAIDYLHGIGWMQTHDKQMYEDGQNHAQPERKKGKWIRKLAGAWMWTCSYCGKDDAYAYSADDAYEPTVLQDFFCPNCGADMRGEQDE